MWWSMIRWLVAFEMLRFRLCEHPPRVVTASGKERPVVVFTDGACENEDDDNYVASVGGVLYPSCGSKPLFFGGRVPDDLVKQWRSNKKTHYRVGRVVCCYFGTTYMGKIFEWKEDHLFY